MARIQTVIMHDASLASLVALAREVASDPRQAISVFFFKDAHAATETRRKRTHKQAQRYRATRTVEIDASHLGRPAPVGSVSARLSIDQSQRLLGALGRAIELGAERIVWPAVADGDAQQAARCIELATLARHIVSLDGVTPPVIDTPLAELTVRQLVEVAGQLGVPFDLCWDCETAGPDPCGGCDACRARRAAFEEAGIVDPLMQSAPATR